MKWSSTLHSLTLPTLALAVLAGCAASNPESSSLPDAWRTRTDRAAPSPHARSVEATPPSSAPNPHAAVAVYAKPPTSPVAPVATVSGRPIANTRFVELLVRARGAGLLEQFIVLEAAEHLAAQRGLSVSDDEVAAEYEHALRELTASAEDPVLPTRDRAAAESILNTVLAQRNVSLQEFMLGMRRNALLRKLVEQEQVVTAAQLHAEFVRRYGPRARVTVVRIPSPAEAPAIRQRLASLPAGASEEVQTGPSFRSGLNIELLGPFSAEDEQIPRIIRQAAFALQPGQISDVLRLDDRLLLLRIEEVRQADNNVRFDDIRAELEQAVRQHQHRKAMAALYDRLLREADVRINDPVLRETFEQAFPGRTR